MKSLRLQKAILVENRIADTCWCAPSGPLWCDQGTVTADPRKAPMTAAIGFNC